MSMSRSGLHDRRGFDGPIKISLAMVVVSFLFMVFVKVFIGLALAMFFACTFIVLETISAPPANRPEIFVTWARRQGGRKPVLLCLGDSLTHGQISASITPEIPTKLCEKLGMDPPRYGALFAEPVWVVNAGQNGITSHTILTERLNKALACYPDFICIMIGTNDVLSMCGNSMLKSHIIRSNDLPEEPTMQIFERNLKGIVNHIRQASPKVQIGICTLPPITEDINSRPNQLVREANFIIEHVAETDGERCAVIPVYSRLESILEKKTRRSMVSLNMFLPVSMIQNYMFHLLRVCFTWNRISALFGQHLLPDGVHLNETACDEVVDAIVDWLMLKHVAKAIAVKSM